MSANHSPEETEEETESEETESEVKSTISDSETRGKQLYNKYSNTKRNLSHYRYITDTKRIFFILFTTELLQLPDGWREARTLEGQVIYIDDRTMKFQMMRPKNGKFL